MKTNSNSYTIIYSAILVVIVAFLLAFVSQALKAKQEVNVALDQKKQILYSLNIRDLNDNEVEKTFKEVVKGKNTEYDKPESNDAPNLGPADPMDGKDGIYYCEVNGKQLKVFPLKGMGLWGGISGYISLTDDGTVYGAYFNHESETAGLGAEIKDNLEWQQKFQGKKVFKEGVDGIALGVVKNVTDPETQVDGVTGSTLTSDGVNNMLKDCLSKYIRVTKKFVPPVNK